MCRAQTSICSSRAKAMWRGECSWLPQTHKAAKHVIIYLYLATSTRRDGGDSRVMRQECLFSLESSKPDHSKDQHNFGKLPSSQADQIKAVSVATEHYYNHGMATKTSWPSHVLEKQSDSIRVGRLIAIELTLTLQKNQVVLQSTEIQFYYINDKQN